MIRLKPNPENYFTCPECGVDHPRINQIRFESINVLADCTCTLCGYEFHQVLPVGHMVDYPISIGKERGGLHHRDSHPDWLADAVLKSHREYRKEEVGIERMILKKCRSVVILNALDSLYGHVLLKLYNAFHHLDQQKEIGLVLIIPKIFKWLIPQGCAEVWVVDLKLDQLVYGYEAIRKFVSIQSERFSEIYLSKAYSHPEFSTVDIERLTGVSPFNLETFSTRRPTVTFVLREDRWWFGIPLDYWFYRVCRKLKISTWGNRLLSKRQNRLVKRTIKLIRKELPDSDFFIVGLGKTGTYDGLATDERQVEVNPFVEKAWCMTYAKSHVVIGIHGSNMLLPTALAAGCVEILPEDRYGNMVQDISVRYTNRLQLFFYRFVDQFANSESVSGKAVAIIRDYKAYHRSMCCNTYSTEPTFMTTLPVVDDARH